MPYLPNLAASQQYPLMTTQFLGYNANPVVADGELNGMYNLTSNAFPLLSVRSKRGVVQQLDKPSGLLGKDALAVVDGTQLYYDGYAVPGITLSDAEDMCPKQMVSMGAYLCIFPDKVYVNTQDLTDCGTMEATFTTPAGNEILVSMCRQDGTDYDTTNILVAEDAPSDPTNGMLWIDTSGKVHTLKQYAATTAEWVQVVTVYIKIQSPGIGGNFNQYDAVKVSGADYDSETEPDVVGQVADLNGDKIIYACGEDYIVVVGFVDKAVTLTSSITVHRDVPDCDYVCESNNRLWGCKYGMVDGKPVNEIYACKLGDFKNWRVYMGQSTDSYAVSVGTDGKFTGAITLRGYPTFFKEGCIHRISGAFPAQYQVTTTMCRGVQDGSERSLQVVGETLYYKGRTDVMQYDGSLPVSISASLGNKLYYDGVGGAYGNKYYLSMRDADGIWSLFVWDAAKGMWHREDELHALGFTSLDDELYCIDADSKQLLALNGTVGTPEPDLPWEAEFGTFGYDYEEQKYLSRFNIRLQMSDGARAQMWIQYDSDGVWHDQGEMEATTTATVMVPVIPRRCDHCKVKLTGVGHVRIFSIARILEVGGDGYAI